MTFAAVVELNVDATEQARRVIAEVAATRRDGLAVVLGTGCCDSTAPFLYDRYHAGPDSVRVGAIDGVPVLAPRWLADLYAGSPALIVDVMTGEPNDSFSLEADLDCRLVLRSPSGSFR